MAERDRVTIFGLGFTGLRVARRLLARGVPVTAAVRDLPRFQLLADQGAKLVEWSLDPGTAAPILDRRTLLLHSIPPLRADQTAVLRENIRSLDPIRVVYISSTGVYGEQSEVDENTPAEPEDARGRDRLREENWLLSGPWSTVILRAAAIYGPWRGVHRALREGRAPRGAGVVSRIHVEDLAAIADAALWSDISGAWPVADDYPCPSSQIIDWCAQYPGPDGGTAGAQSPEQLNISGRRVSGGKIRALLGVALAYPTWKTGIPACLTEEKAQPLSSRGKG